MPQNCLVQGQLSVSPVLFSKRDISQAIFILLSASREGGVRMHHETAFYLWQIGGNPAVKSMREKL